MATKPHSTAPDSAPAIGHDWIGYLGLATPFAVLALALIPLMLGEG